MTYDEWKNIQRSIERTAAEMRESAMFPDEDSFLPVRVEKPLMCMQCNAADDKIVIANEPIFIEGEFRGLEGIVRFAECGHLVWGATADPVSVAFMLEELDSPEVDE
jgi:hypothetical protein